MKERVLRGDLQSTAQVNMNAQHLPLSVTLNVWSEWSGPAMRAVETHNNCVCIGGPSA
jgi:hypothetical protein